MESVSDKDFLKGGMGVHIQEALEDWEAHCNVSVEKFNSTKCQMMHLD